MADEPVEAAELVQAAPEEEQGEPLPTHKDDLVALAIERNVPSYKAWAMTVTELTKLLKG